MSFKIILIVLTFTALPANYFSQTCDKRNKDDVCMNKDMNSLVDVNSQNHSGITVPETLLNIFGNWIRNETTLKSIRQSIMSSQLVIINNAFADDLAIRMRNEISSIEYTREPTSNPIKHKYYKTLPHVLRTSSKLDVCENLLHDTNGEFFFYHEKPKNREDLKYIKSIGNILNSNEANRFIDYLLGYEQPTILGATMGVRSFPPGAMYGLHNDDVNSRKSGLSMTSYFTNPKKKWKKRYGGNFVWCANSFSIQNNQGTKIKTKTEATYIPPSYNSMILFRVDDYTEHFVEPLEKGAPTRYVFQGWWIPSRVIDTAELPTIPGGEQRQKIPESLNRSVSIFS